MDGAQGFVYLVARLGVTGASRALAGDLAESVQRVRGATGLPVAVGFGVSKPAHARAIAKAGADGVIVASALVDALGPDGRDVAALSTLVEKLREATRA